MSNWQEMTLLTIISISEPIFFIPVWVTQSITLQVPRKHLFMYRSHCRLSLHNSQRFTYPLVQSYRSALLTREIFTIVRIRTNIDGTRSALLALTGSLRCQTRLKLWALSIIMQHQSINYKRHGLMFMELMFLIWITHQSLLERWYLRKFSILILSRAGKAAGNWTVAALPQWKMDTCIFWCKTIV